jgi:serine/threonine protein phosphatase PrpC
MTIAKKQFSQDAFGISFPSNHHILRNEDAYIYSITENVSYAIVADGISRPNIETPHEAGDGYEAARYVCKRLSVALDTLKNQFENSGEEALDINVINHQLQNIMTQAYTDIFSAKLLSESDIKRFGTTVCMTLHLTDKLGETHIFSVNGGDAMAIVKIQKKSGEKTYLYLNDSNVNNIGFTDMPYQAVQKPIPNELIPSATTRNMSNPGFNSFAWHVASPQFKVGYYKIQEDDASVETLTASDGIWDNMLLAMDFNGRELNEFKAVIDAILYKDSVALTHLLYILDLKVDDITAVALPAKPRLTQNPYTQTCSSFYTIRRPVQGATSPEWFEREMYVSSGYV